MASSSTGVGGEAAGSRDDVKTQFTTREGLYKLVTLSDCMRPSRVPQNGPANVPVRLSFVGLGDRSGGAGAVDDRVCFNIGKELYFYQYDGTGKVLDLTRPLDKRLYRGTMPTCHDFNLTTASPEHVFLVIGFSAGQIQLIDPISKDLSKLYNEERTLDKTKVTCIRWVPDSSHMFITSYASGQLYVHDVELSCTANLTSSGVSPHYQVMARGDAFTVYTCRAKTMCNPVQRWTVGTGAVNEFAFSPCGRYLAIVSADGYLRVFVYSTAELVGVMRSYFGGLLCVTWSPDGRYIATGGEDDLVTIWSLAERRVICRGRGHRSWVSCVAFDPFAVGGGSDFLDFCGSDDDISRPLDPPPKADAKALPDGSPHGSPCGSSHGSGHDAEEPLQSYRLGSVGHDAMLCLWDITEDVLRRPFTRARTSTITSRTDTDGAQNGVTSSVESSVNDSANNKSSQKCLIAPPSSVVQKFATLTLGDRPAKEKQRRSASGTSSEHRWHFSLASRSSDSKIQLLKAAAAATNTTCICAPAVDDAVRLLGTPACPRLSDSPMLVPLVGKRVAHERLTALVFREDCVVMTCQEGIIYTFARPGKAVLVHQSLSGTHISSNATAL